MPTLAEIAADAKDALADAIASTEGLRPANNVAVISVPSGPPPGDKDSIHLVDVTWTAEGRPDLKGRGARYTMTGALLAPWGDGGETKGREARRRAVGLMAKVEEAVQRDPYVGGAIPGPAGTQVASSALQEGLGDWNGQSLLHTRIPFTVTWESHVR
jgi:hypothetical protein